MGQGLPGHTHQNIPSATLFKGQRSADFDEKVGRMNFGQKI